MRIEAVVAQHSWFYWLFHQKPRNPPAMVLSLDTGRGELVKGIEVKNLDNGVLVEYKTKDGIPQAFTDIKPVDKIAMIDGMPLYVHEVGSVLGQYVRFHMPPGEVQRDGVVYANYGADLNDRLISSTVACDIVDKLESLADPKPFPWKMLLIVGGIAIGVFFLWQSGMLDKLIAGVANQNPAPVTPVPPVPGG